MSGDIVMDRSSGLWVYDPAWPEGAPRPLYLDGCPSCVKALNVPKRVAPQGEGVRADYVCHVCGHVWFTGWARDPDDVTTRRDDPDEWHGRLFCTGPDCCPPDSLARFMWGES